MMRYFLGWGRLEVRFWVGMEGMKLGRESRDIRGGEGIEGIVEGVREVWEVEGGIDIGTLMSRNIRREEGGEVRSIEQSRNKFFDCW